MSKKVVLYFGSFNPVHQGHLAIANYMVDSAICDDLWLVVSPNNPHKDMCLLLDENHRLEMTKLATKEWSSDTATGDTPNITKCNITTCDIEFKMDRPSYTINTITEIINQYNRDIEFSLLIGEDNIFSFDRWHRWIDILKLVDVIIYPRVTNCLQEVEDKIEQLCISGDFERSKFKYLCDAPLIELSSTRIRELIASGAMIESCTTQKVIEYIIKNKLYGNECREEDNS